MQGELVWHDDGHVLVLELHKSELVVVTTMCPNAEGACKHGDVGCIVSYFVRHYGLDVHIGVCPPEPEMRVAWALQGNPSHIDECQVILTSTTDSLWEAWRTAQA